VTFTMGGPVVDVSGRVLARSESPIAGLFAAGGAVGGFHGGQHVGFAGGLVMAAVTGLVVGESALLPPKVGISTNPVGMATKGEKR
jgi:predicted oxidoreductase